MRSRKLELLNECCCILQELDYMALFFTPSSTSIPFEDFRTSLRADIAHFSATDIDDNDSVATLEVIRSGSINMLNAIRTEYSNQKPGISAPDKQAEFYKKFHDHLLQAQKLEDQETKQFLNKHKAELRKVALLQKMLMQQNELSKYVKAYDEWFKKHKDHSRSNVSNPYYAIHYFFMQRSINALRVCNNKISRTCADLQNTGLELLRLSQKNSLCAVALVPHMGLPDFMMA